MADLNIVAILIAAAIAWAALRGEFWLRSWFARRGSTPRVPAIAVPQVTGTTQGSASSVRCLCGHSSKSFTIFSGDRKVCMQCVSQGVIVCSCGHADVEYKTYPSGTVLCSKCSKRHDSRTTTKELEEEAHQVHLRNIERNEIIARVAEKVGEKK